MIAAAVVFLLFCGNVIGFVMIAMCAGKYAANGQWLLAAASYLAVLSQAIVVSAGVRVALQGDDEP